MKDYTHDALCLRAAQWLSGTMRCNPVFRDCASCSEIPDAIGWSSGYKHRGSIVVECKTSTADFIADKKKRFVYDHNEHGLTFSAHRFSEKEAAESGYEKREVLSMGDYRYFACADPEVITVQSIEKHAPDHGLLHFQGRRVRVVIPAPRRERVDYPLEIRYLRFAIINNKKSHAQVVQQMELCAAGKMSPR